MTTYKEFKSSVFFILLFMIFVTKIQCKIIGFILLNYGERSRYAESSPGGFDNCQKNSPNFDDCLTPAIEKGIMHLKAGLPALKIAPVDPFKKKSLTVGAGTGAVLLTQYYKNLVITGFTDLKVNQSHFDWPTKTMTFTSIHPKVEQKADYDINGKLLVLPVQGKGDCRITLDELAITHTIQFQEIKKNNVPYFKVKTYLIKLTPKHASYQLNNLFNGNKLLGDNINKLINEEWETLFLDVREGYEKGYGDVFFHIAESIFDKIPLKELFS